MFPAEVVEDLLQLFQVTIDLLMLCGSNKVRIIISTCVNILGVRGISTFTRAGEQGMSSDEHISMQYDILHLSEASVEAIIG